MPRLARFYVLKVDDDVNLPVDFHRNAFPEISGHDSFCCHTILLKVYIFGKIGKVFQPVRFYYCHILDTHAAHAVYIDARLDRDDHVFGERLVGEFGQPGILVNLHAHAVAERVA